jgi:hypothetical protein
MAAAIPPLHQPLNLPHPIEDKCFFLISNLDEVPELRRVMQQDAGMGTITEAKRHAISDAAGRTSATATDITRAARFSDDDIKQIGSKLKRIFGEHPDARAMLVARLRESGMFVREQARSDDDLTAFAWQQSAVGINRMIDIYGDGKRPFYPKIDSRDAVRTDAEWGNSLSNLAVKAVDGTPPDHDLFFGASMRLALAMLELNGRDEAGRFEPMADGENKAAISRIGRIEWAKYPYSCILVPGIGPDTPDVALSKGGRENVQLAAEQFKAGLAPLIITSGGYVHPNKTRFCEAVEMRRELIEKLQIPADAVMIDPHARHTTTNIRNAARLIYRYGIPFQKPVLVTSNAVQIKTVQSDAFARRCENELGYDTARIGKLLEPTKLEITFTTDCLEADPMSPLDP